MHQRLFVSYSTHDVPFVRDLRQALDDFDQGAWIDSRELRGGDPLWEDICKAIDAAAAYAVVVSPDALQSKWVGKELRQALLVQEQRGKDNFPVIPLSLDGTQLGAFGLLFGDDEPIYIPVTSAGGGIDAALHAILVALGKRLATDLDPTPQPKAEPLEDLVLELSDLKFNESDGVRRASARARLAYEPATAGQPEVWSVKSWRFVAPLGPIETSELRWYLEKYAIWPSGVFRDRARQVEQQLVEWGKLLHEAAMPLAPTANVRQAWDRIDHHSGRRFSIYVDPMLEADAPASDVENAREAATLLIGLPWELLHNGSNFLFQGSKPTRVRRSLPRIHVLDMPVVAPPIRILLASPRPEDEALGYFDHRSSALPLVEAMEALGGLVHIHILNPPTLPGLREELDRVRRIRAPYHVVHFDGHGVYDHRVGLGGLCFEDPQDSDKLERRRHQTVFTDELGPLLNHHRIPLVFLEACQSAQARQASESVASDLLKKGVGSVVAMSHNVLVETSRRFVGAFYGALADGTRVGGAMLAGQRALKDDSFRGSVFGAGELRLADWFVPVLFQGKEDPQLFRSTTAQQTREDLKRSLATRLGELPQAPATGFIGRSRDLLALERLLRNERYAVLRGQGGEGKTALAAELARWLVRSQQIRRAAFVSLETNGNATALLDSLGRQLVGKAYSTATFDNLEQAILPVERALAEQSTLLVVDNMEVILLPPYLETAQALTDDAHRELSVILALCARLHGKGETRLIFTSRENLPTPFATERNRLELYQLAREDAVKLVERVLNVETNGGNGSAPGEASSEAIEQLVDAIHGHARTIALLAPSLRQCGVEQTRAALVELMAEMEQRYPRSRERSLYASVELSLQRLSPANRDKARVLGIFHGGLQLGLLQMMMQWEEADVAALAGELIQTGLAIPNPYNYITLNPALCPYLRERMNAPERKALTARWREAMLAYAELLRQQQNQNAEVAATLTALELPNLFALLEQVQRAGDEETTIALVTTLYSLLQALGKPRLLERVGKIRDAVASALGETWNHAHFEAQRTRIEQQLAGGRLREALDDARTLLQKARTMGEQPYSGAEYDLAGACWLLARVLKTAGGSEHALQLFGEARMRFESIANELISKAAEGMVCVCFAELGDCFRYLGRLDEAAAAYEESIRRAEKLGDYRSVALGKSSLGTVCLEQSRYLEALAAYDEARERFKRLDEPGSIAVIWHQTGMANQNAGRPEEAEDAYRQSLAISVRIGDVAGEASALNQIGILYNDALGRTEEALAFFRQAVDKSTESGDVAKEGSRRNNLAVPLQKLRRLDEARQEICRAIECKAQFGHAALPWSSWAILADIETDAGNQTAASEARAKAIACYLAYLRDGGENHEADGRIALAVTQALLAGNPAAAASFLQEIATAPEAAWLLPFIKALEAIVAGGRVRRLADNPDLHYTMAAEIIFLIETLEQAVL